MEEVCDSITAAPTRARRQYRAHERRLFWEKQKEASLRRRKLETNANQQLDKDLSTHSVNPSKERLSSNVSVGRVRGFVSTVPASVLTLNGIRRRLSATLSFVGYGVAVAHTKTHGVGLLATRDFPANSIITQYEGVVVSPEEVSTVYESTAVPLGRGNNDGATVTRGHLVGMLGRGGAIDGLKKPIRGRGGGSFANHSETPNGKWYRCDTGVFIRAAVSISKGEYITINYGTGKSVEMFSQ